MPRRTSTALPGSTVRAPASSETNSTVPPTVQEGAIWPSTLRTTARSSAPTNACPAAGRLSTASFAPATRFRPVSLRAVPPFSRTVPVHVALPKAKTPGPQAKVERLGLGVASSSPARTSRPSGWPFQPLGESTKKSAFTAASAPSFAAATPTVVRPVGALVASLIAPPVGSAARRRAGEAGVMRRAWTTRGVARSTSSR